MALYSSFAETVGNTPIFPLKNLTRNIPASIFMKLEYLNPVGSVKDRIAMKMLETAEEDGKIKPGMTLIEATNGNTGISLASFCRSKGYRLIVVMPETMSIERRTMLFLLGAEVVLTPKEYGLRGSFAKVHEIVRKNPDYYFINQGENVGNPLAHHQTAKEILEDLDGKIDLIVLGVGTGGTFKGIYQYFKEHSPKTKIIAVEPEESAVLSGGEAGLHRIPGIGPGIRPPFLDDLEIDGVEKISSDQAYEMAREVIREEGIPVGVSSGAAVLAALNQGKKIENEGMNIITLATSYTERYLSTELASKENQKALELEVEDIQESDLNSVEGFFKNR